MTRGASWYPFRSGFGAGVSVIHFGRGNGPTSATDLDAVEPGRLALSYYFRKSSRHATNALQLFAFASVLPHYACQRNRRGRNHREHSAGCARNPTGASTRTADGAGRTSLLAQAMPKRSAERRSRISFDALHHHWALLPVHPRSRRAIASCSGPLNPSSVSCRPFGRTGGTGGGPPEPGGVRHLVGVGRKNRG
jgi:hypothetical protein